MAVARVSACWLSVVLAAAILGGCRHGDVRSTFGQDSEKYELELSGAEGVDWSKAAIDIDNHAGSVRVEVEPWRTEPFIKARVRSGEKFKEEPPIDVVTEVLREEGRPAILRIATEPKAADTRDVYADIWVRLPGNQGVRVANADGPVELMGVGGAVTVDNGRGTSPGGNVWLRTERRIDEPVALVTTTGHVTAVFGAEADGDLRLETDDGFVTVKADKTPTTGVEVATRSWTGTLNGGTNPIVLRSGRGAVRFYARENPEAFAPAPPIVARGGPLLIDRGPAWRDRVTDPARP